VTRMTTQACWNKRARGEWNRRTRSEAEISLLSTGRPIRRNGSTTTGSILQGNPAQSRTIGRRTEISVASNQKDRKNKLCDESESLSAEDETYACVQESFCLTSPRPRLRPEIVAHCWPSARLLEVECSPPLALDPRLHQSHTRWPLFLLPSCARSPVNVATSRVQSR